MKRRRENDEESEQHGRNAEVYQTPRGVSRLVHRGSGQVAARVPCQSPPNLCKQLRGPRGGAEADPSDLMPDSKLHFDPSLLDQAPFKPNICVNQRNGAR